MEDDSDSAYLLLLVKLAVQVKAMHQFFKFFTAQ